MKLAPEAFEIVACVFQPMSTKGPQRRKRRASLAEQAAAQAIDKMKPVTRLADYGFVGRRRVLRLGIVEPVLHVQAGIRTFEDDITHRSVINSGLRRIPS
jgi:hypothetical protein